MLYDAIILLQDTLVIMSMEMLCKEISSGRPRVEPTSHSCVHRECAVNVTTTLMLSRGKSVALPGKSKVCLA